MEPLDFQQLVSERLEYWQESLALRDWAIKVEYWPHLSFDGAVSKIHYSRNQKFATIALRMPEDISPCEREWPEGEAADYDLSIVHELLHLKCVDMECRVDWAEEQLCNHLAKALVSAHRLGRTSEGSSILEAARPLPEGDSEASRLGGYI